MKEQIGAFLVGFMIVWCIQFYWLYLREPVQRNPLRRQTRFELWLQKKRYELEQYDLERLVQVSLICVIVLSGIWSIIFKPVISP